MFALLVVVYHAYIAHPALDHVIVRNGWAAVDYFFLLSGFVISFAFVTRLQSSQDLGRFTVQRIARLWPLHLVTFFVALAFFTLQAVGRGEGGEALRSIAGPAIADMFMLTGLPNTRFMRLNFPAWSISVEMMVYIVFGLVTWVSLFLGPKARSVLVAVLLGVSGAVLCGVFVAPFGQAFGNGLWRGIFYFFLGYLCWVLYGRLAARGVSFGTAAEAFVLACVLAVFLVHQDKSPDPIRPWLMGAVFGGAILVLALGRGRVSDVLKTRPLLLLAKLSFSIYLTHILVLQISGAAMCILDHRVAVDLLSEAMVDGRVVQVIDLGSPALKTIYMGGLIAFVIGLSALTWRWVEQPGQALGKRLAGRWFGARAAVSQA